MVSKPKQDSKTLQWALEYHNQNWSIIPSHAVSQGCYALLKNQIFITNTDLKQGGDYA